MKPALGRLAFIGVLILNLAWIAAVIAVVVWALRAMKVIH